MAGLTVAASAGVRWTVAVLALGEVKTTLLGNSVALGPATAMEPLEFHPGTQTRRTTRPVGYTVSADVLTGIDVELGDDEHPPVRCVGATVSRALITGGRVLQASTFARLDTADTAQRLPWREYLRRPGVLQVADESDAARRRLLAGFLELAPAAQDRLGLDAVNDRVLGMVQRSPRLDRLPPLRTRRLSLRWTASTTSTGRSGIHLRIEHEALRTLRLAVAADDLPAVVDLCEDLALHEWLLSTLTQVFERVPRGLRTPAETIAGLRPAVEHLLHLWMPAARLEAPMVQLWSAVDERAGLSRQWDALVARARDLIALRTLDLLDAVAGPDPGSEPGAGDLGHETRERFALRALDRLDALGGHSALAEPDEDRLDPVD
jgi:hypothetical protein